VAVISIRKLDELVQQQHKTHLRGATDTNTSMSSPRVLSTNEDDVSSFLKGKSSNNIHKLNSSLPDPIHETPLVGRLHTTNKQIYSEVKEYGLPLVRQFESLTGISKLEDNFSRQQFRPKNHTLTHININLSKAYQRVEERKK
jgi:hypothetical protein